jgi:hypothetical protein
MKANEHWPILFLDLVEDYLQRCDAVTVEDQDGDSDMREAIFILRHGSSGICTELRCPESPSFVEAQEWCLGFFGQPLHELLRAADQRSRERIAKKTTEGGEQ